jgi:hypothetical protein
LVAVVTDNPVALKEHWPSLAAIHVNRSFLFRAISKELDHESEVSFTDAAPVIPSTLNGSFAHTKS